jgi:hypothetical protein
MLKNEYILKEKYYYKKNSKLRIKKKEKERERGKYCKFLLYWDHALKIHDHQIQEKIVIHNQSFMCTIKDSKFCPFGYRVTRP